MDINYGEVLQNYEDAGLCVIACHPRQKRPIGESWESQRLTLADGTPDPKRISNFEKAFAAAQRDGYPNIGLLGGEASDNLIAIDFDHHVERNFCRPELEELLLSAVVVKTGKEGGAGRHVWLKTDEPLLNCYRWHHDGELCGEVRGLCNTLVPPSIHPVTGDRYELLSGSWQNLPKIPYSQIKELFPEIAEAQKPTGVAGIPKFTENFPNLPKFAQTKEYQPDFTSIRWIDFFQAQGWVYRIKGDKAHVQCPNIAQHTDDGRNPHEDTSTTIIRNADGVETFKCLHSHCQHITMQYLTTLYKDLLEPYSEPWQANPNFRSAPPKQPLKEVKIVEEAKEEVKQDPNCADASKYQLTGFCGQWQQHIIESSRYPQPVLAAGAVLAAAGSLLGRRVITSDELATNLYCIGLAPTASGKNHIFSQIDEAFVESLLTARLTGGDFTADASIVKILQKQPDSLVMIDEVAEILDGIFGEKGASGEITLQQKIARLLLEWYTASHPRKLWRGKEYANQDRPEVYMPCISIYGCTVPRSFFELLRPIHVENGLLNRLLIFHTHDRKLTSRQPTIAGAVPDFVTRQAFTLDQLPVHLGDLPNNVGKPEPHVLSYSAQAENIFHQVRLWTDEQRATTPPYYELYLRMEEQTKKIALILAAANGEGQIEENHVISAYNIVEDSIRVLRQNLMNQTKETRYSQKHKALMNVVKAAGENGLSLTELGRKFREPKRERDALIEDMEFLGLLEKFVGDHGTYRTERIRAILNPEEFKP
jgi:hypothetical protein